MLYIVAGRTEDPTIILFPAFHNSANEYSKFIPLLSLDYPAVAPSYPVFGLTTVPANFTYNFSSIANVISGHLLALNITSYAAYMPSYGGRC